MIEPIRIENWEKDLRKIIKKTKRNKRIKKSIKGTLNVSKDDSETLHRMQPVYTDDENPLQNEHENHNIINKMK